MHADTLHKCKRCDKHFVKAHFDDVMQMCHNCILDIAEEQQLEQEREEQEERDFCYTCRGTGIGQGDPNTSKCTDCGGSGSLRNKREREERDLEYADYEYDRRKDERAEAECERRCCGRKRG